MTGSSERVSMGRNVVGMEHEGTSVHRPAPAWGQLAGLAGAGRRVLELRGIDAPPHLLDGVGRSPAGDRRDRPGVVTTLQREQPEKCRERQYGRDATSLVRRVSHLILLEMQSIA
jgi:hypothetical protein